jgi:hypothetical protein
MLASPFLASRPLNAATGKRKYLGPMVSSTDAVEVKVFRGTLLQPTAIIGFPMVTSTSVRKYCGNEKYFWSRTARVETLLLSNFSPYNL